MRHLLLTEKEQITERLHQGLLRRDAHEQLLASVNKRLDRLDDGKYDDVFDLVLVHDSSEHSTLAPTGNPDRSASDVRERAEEGQDA